MTTTHFFGSRNERGDARVVIRDDHGTRALGLRLNIRNHSPTGFEWGYGGSGPAQLALAMICEVTGDRDLALATYQRFKAEIVQSLPRDRDWTLGFDEVEKFVRLLPRKELSGL